MLAGLGVYLLNFLAGKSKNSRLAQAWLKANKNLLEQHFHVVGEKINVFGDIVECAWFQRSNFISSWSSNVVFSLNCCKCSMLKSNRIVVGIGMKSDWWNWI